MSGTELKGENAKRSVWYSMPRSDYEKAILNVDVAILKKIFYEFLKMNLAVE